MQAGSRLLIIADDVEGEALTTLILNKLRGTLDVVAVKAPGYGDGRKAMLEDITILTGGQAVLDDLGMQIKDVTMGMLGQADSVKVTKDETVIVGGQGKKEEIEERINSIKRQAAETEMKEAKYRLEDALNATRAAVEEGIIAGGGSAYIHAQKDLQKVMESLEGDEKTGAQIVEKALEAPLRAIVENAGLEGAVIINKVKESKIGEGFDAASEVYVDMVEAGIIDPVKVTRSALKHAVSVSSTLLTTEAAVADIKEAVPTTATENPEAY